MDGVLVKWGHGDGGVFFAAYRRRAVAFNGSGVTVYDIHAIRWGPISVVVGTDAVTVPLKS